MEYEHSSAICNQACFEMANIRDRFFELAFEMKRPFMLLKPRVFPDGDKWCALYGDSIQEGVAGFGDTPEKASIQFDIEWLNSTLKPPQNL